MKLQAYQAIAVIMSTVAVATVIELIRRRRIQDALWLPWLLVAFMPALLGLWTQPWAWLAHRLGILYEPLLLVAIASFLSFGVLLHLSVVVSTLIGQNLRLAQEVALLREELERVARPNPQDVAGNSVPSS